MSITLNVKNRTGKEKIEGMMPAVMYGAHAKTTSIFVDRIEFKKALKSAGESGVITMTGDHNENVLLHDMQRGAVSYEPIHADFYVVEKGQKMHINIPLRFVGDAPAAKMNANIVKVLQELSVEMDPTKAPHDIEVDLSTLVDTHSAIHISDIALPKGATLYNVNVEDVVVSVVAQSDEDLSAAVEQVDMEAVAVVEKGKKDVEEVAA